MIFLMPFFDISFAGSRWFQRKTTSLKVPSAQGVEHPLFGPFEDGIERLSCVVVDLTVHELLCAMIARTAWPIFQAVFWDAPIHFARKTDEIPLLELIMKYMAINHVLRGNFVL